MKKLFLLLAIIYTQFLNGQIINTVAGTGSTTIRGYFDSGVATAIALNSPSMIAFDADGNYYITENGKNCIKKISASGFMRTITSHSDSGICSGDGGPASAAQLNKPMGIVYNTATKDLYFCDQGSSTIRKIDSNGIITRFAGTGVAGDSDVTNPLYAKFRNPYGLVKDNAGNLYVADHDNHKVRKINISTGAVTTIAGTGTSGYSGDGGPATAANLKNPYGVDVDSVGNIYVADAGGNRVRKIDISGIITTVAGTGDTTLSVDGSPATATNIRSPYGVNYYAPWKALFISEPAHNLVRLVDSFGIVTTFAGDRTYRLSGDGGLATNAGIGFVIVSMDNSGNMYLVSGAVREITMSLHPITVPSVLMCVGAQDTLSDSGNTGGKWTVSNTAIATIDSNTGVLTGVSVGRVTVTYFPGAFGVWVTTSIFVHHSPSTPSISGSGPVCPGHTVNFTGTASGGAWASSSAVTATVGSTGVVYGVASGSAIISYTRTDTSGCALTDTQAITVLPLAITPTISGADSVCAGGTDTLIGSASGGIWVSSNSSVATVSSSGVVHGVSIGTTTISYGIVSACDTAWAVFSFRVTGIPPPVISGSTAGCYSGSVTLTGSPSGGSWVSSNTSVATISTSGVVFGVDTGTTIITYSATNSCGSSSTTLSLPIITPPYVGTPTGDTLLCVGSTTTCLDTTVGGSWACYMPSIATVSSTGVVLGVSEGTAIIEYSKSNACGTTYMAHIMRIIPLPRVGVITGDTLLCMGSTLTLGDTSTLGGWHTSSSVIATVNSSGVVTPVSTGVATIYYTYSNYCGADTQSKRVHVNETPTASSISGPSVVCVGSAITLAADDTSVAASYSWSSSNTSIATVSSTGVVTGVTGTHTVTITFTATNYCGTVHLTHVVQVIALPHVGAITGDTLICVGATTTLHDTSTLGVWSSADTTIATISSTGVVTPAASGMVTLQYTYSNYCGSDTASFSLHVLGVPIVDTITGPSDLCGNVVMPYADSPLGGLWSSSDSTIVSIDSTGTATSHAVGVATISYTATNACGTTVVTKTVSVHEVPAGIMGNPHMCVNDVQTLTDATAGGTWDISGGALIDGMGVVTAISAGTAVATYTTAFGCTTIFGITIDTLPNLRVAPFPLVACGDKMELWVSGAATYEWFPTSSFGVSTGSLVTATSITATTTYTVVGVDSNGCSDTATQEVVVPDCSVCLPTGDTVYALKGMVGLPGLSTTIPNYHFYVAEDVFVEGDVLFDGSVLSVAAHKNIFSNPEAKITFDGVHAFCCDTAALWNGLQSASAVGFNSGRIETRNNTLIEDAEKAISVVGTDMVGDSLLLNIRKTVFNRNRTGIYIENYAGHTLPEQLPFKITNCIFTSRNMSYFSDSFSHVDYPKAWPAVSGTSTALKARYNAPGYYTPKLNILNPTGAGYGNGYVPRKCNDGNYADAGIVLKNVGSFADTAGSPNGACVFSQVLIGDTFAHDSVLTNIFDTIMTGIYAFNSNFTCRNSLFMFIFMPPSGTLFTYLPGEAIVANAEPDTVNAEYNKYYMNVVGPYLDHVVPDSFMWGNYYYNCPVGIDCQNYYYALMHNNNIIYEPGFWATAPALYGIKVNTARYYDLKITRNLTHQQRNAIVFDHSILTGAATPQFSGYMNINGNWGMDDSYWGMFSKMPVFGSVDLGVTAHIDSNWLLNPGDGVSVTGFINQRVSTDTNIILLSGRTGLSSSQQYGIMHSNCLENSIERNIILGSSLIPVPNNFAFTSFPSVIGVIGKNNSDAVVKCNVIANLSAAFFFDGATNWTQWRNNVMERDSFGMVMRGAFGWQGTITNPSGNVWRRNNTTDWVLRSNRTIVTLNSYPPSTLSSIFYSNDIGYDIYDPSYNVNQPINDFNTYGGYTGSGDDSGLLSTNLTVAPDCQTYDPLYPTLYYRGVKKSDALDSLTQLRLTSILFPDLRLDWIGQYNLYRNLKIGRLSASGSNLANLLLKNGDNCRFGILFNLEQNYGTGNTGSMASMIPSNINYRLDTSVDDSTGLMMQDLPEANSVVENYYLFYGIAANNASNSLSRNDSNNLKQLALRCSYLNGDIVFSARTLYRKLFQDDTTIFVDTCFEDSTGYAYRKQTRKAGEEKIQLFPNPNDGNFMVVSSNAKTQDVTIKIKDAIGRVELEQKLVSHGGKFEIKAADLNQGMHIVEVQYGNGKLETFKFLKQ